MAPAIEPLGYTADLASLHPSPLNPRKHFSDLDDLSANIKARGVLVPLLVRPNGKGREIVDGERRYRAAKLAGVTTVPVIERELTDDEVLEIQLISAIQRQDLTPLEEARGYRALIDSNKSKYSAAYIADRIGRSEKYVFDRMKLLDLIPELQQLLEQERILVGHGELLAKHKTADQQRAIAVKKKPYGYGKWLGGLWREAHSTLDFDEPAAEGEAQKAKDPYAGLKAVSVPELAAWLASHVRFDVPHFAAAAPLDFGVTAIKVEEAQQKPGRGKKVIAITDEFRINDDAKDPSERTYGRESWRRADGEQSKTCEHSVLGVFVAGRGQGRTLQVCVARDRCKTHFGKEIREREANAKLRAKGKGGQAAQREQKAQETYDQRWKREAAERKVRQAAWAAIWKHLLPAVVSQVATAQALTPQQVAYFEREEIYIDDRACKTHGLTWSKNLVAALLVSEVVRGDDSEDFDSYVKKYARPLGLDIKELEAIHTTHTPKAAAKAEKVTTSPTGKTTKKAAKKR